MPTTEWPRFPPFSEMDVWLHEAKVVGIEHGTKAALAAAEAKAEADAEAAALAAQQAAWRAAHPLGRPRTRRLGSRPWQAAGYVRKADWMAAGSPGPMEWKDE